MRRNIYCHEKAFEKLNSSLGKGQSTARNHISFYFGVKSPQARQEGQAVTRAGSVPQVQWPAGLVQLEEGGGSCPGLSEGSDTRV